MLGLGTPCTSGGPLEATQLVKETVLEKRYRSQEHREARKRKVPQPSSEAPPDAGGRR